MRLYQRPDSENWYIELKRGKSRSLKTKDKNLAQQIFNEIRRAEMTKYLNPKTQTDLSVLDWKEKYLKSRFGLSENTTRADELALRLLGDVIGQNYPIKNLSEIHVERFKKVSVQRGLKPKSINSYLRHIKASLREAAMQKLVQEVPRVKFIKEPRRLPMVFSKAEVQNIITHLKATDHELWRVVQFALWTGCRRNEILGLRWENITGIKCRIIGKGNKERSIPLLPAALEACGNQKNIGKVFHPYHKDTVSHNFKDALVELKIEGNFHKLRHTAATFMLSSGVPLPVIQKMLGHESISTTEIYAEVEDQLLESELKKLSF